MPTLRSDDTAAAAAAVVVAQRYISASRTPCSLLRRQCELRTAAAVMMERKRVNNPAILLAVSGY